MRQIDEVLPASRLAELPGQGHMAHLTAPELLAHEVAGFLPAADA